MLHNQVQGGKKEGGGRLTRDRNASNGLPLATLVGIDIHNCVPDVMVCPI